MVSSPFSDRAYRAAGYLSDLRVSSAILVQSPYHGLMHWRVWLSVRVLLSAALWYTLAFVGKDLTYFPLPAVVELGQNTDILLLVHGQPEVPGDLLICHPHGS